MMDSPGKVYARKRHGVNNSMSRRAHRSNSNVSSSSTSSDILVAPGPPTTTSKQASLFGSPLPTKGSVSAEVKNNGLLIINFSNTKNEDILQFFKRINAQKKEHISMTDTLSIKLTHEDSEFKKQVKDDVGEGPNHRGTYSKAYVQQHPEIKWVHRGQGRYIPAAQLQSSTSPNSQSHS